MPNVDLSLSTLGLWIKIQLGNAKRFPVPYQFEPLASESDSHTEPEADVVDDDDSGDDERLHSTNWWELACIYEPVDNNFTAMYLLYLTMYM